ncbi:ABC transporter ATP-binding protein [Nocardioides mangrovicus]|uniref:ABC transporter ATP-binding protein n=1 Tax=Nocardioides mangrovicus TaxID=2478913 RepID=A0A3L8NZ35_9ACTN|nr:ABC transporter ATP-binding protein [Nocardioides mangrovicus]RLV47629.1 ABC transporter ATP-binding protein [Nocardioides mangrovicus]
MVGLPDGIAELLSSGTRKRLALSIAGSVLLSVLDTLGVLAMLPMMQLVTRTNPYAGSLGFVNRLLGFPSSRVLLITLAGVVVTAFALKGLVTVLVRTWQLRFMATQEAATSTRLLEGYLRGPYAWHLTRNTSDLIWTVESAVQITFANGITSWLAMLSELFTIVLVFGSLLVVAPLPTLLALIYFGAAGSVMLRFVRRRSALASDRMVASSKITARTSLQAMGAVKEVKLRHAEALFVERYNDARRDSARARAMSMLLSEVPKYLFEVIFVLGIALMAFVATSTGGTAHGLSVLGLFVAAGSRILPSTVRLISSVGGVRYAREPMMHLIAEWQEQEAARQLAEQQVRTRDVPRGDIDVEGLTFAYADSPDDLVLRGVDAHIAQGSSVALVGSSGAGKSTLVDVLLGLHRPAGGQVRAGGVDVFDNLPQWQARLAVVPQDVYLLDDSLRQNICFDEEEDLDRLERVLARAQLTDLIASLPEGLDTTVGERGVRLSGGQRQRIGIARALYRDPEVLVLDEATSALDNETERRLTETIESLRGTMTMVIVAHRLSTVRHCDALLFMNAGRVVSRGSFEEVAAQNAEFAHLVELGSLDPRAEREPTSFSER